VGFIHSLRKAGVPLSHIDSNNWSSNYNPSVYVHNKHNRFVLRRYSRCASGDVKSAVAFYNSKSPRGVR